MTSRAKTPVLFVAYGGGHATMLTCLYHRMMATEWFDITFLGLTTARPVLEKAGIPFIGFSELVVEGDAEALVLGERLWKELPADLVKTPDHEAIAYLGLSYHDLVQRHGETEADVLFRRLGRQAFLPLGPIERLFNRVKPEMVVTTNSPRAEKAAILTARKFGIPAICLVDLFGQPEIVYAGQPGYADRLCVLSEQTKAVFLEAGRKEEEIVVTGNPAFDRWADPTLTERALDLRQSKSWADKKVILWASQPEPSPHQMLPRRVDAELFRIMSHRPEWHCVIRPHPSETVHYESLPVNVSLSVESDDLYVLLMSSDLVITFNSTLGLEGILVGKSLVTVDLSVQCQYLPYSKMGLSIGVKSLEGLEEGIVEALGERPSGQAGLPLLGTACQRVFEVVLELAHKAGIKLG